ncbi:MAG: galactose-1-phosphate uridylyltransferase [Candidatus Methylomirabilales bacterium]
MPELRKDPVTRCWVIISTERGKRPSDFGREPRPARPAFCPFCPGNEEKTPPEIMVYRNDGAAPNTPGWRVRVVTNKFPALVIEGDLERQGEGIYDKMSGVGAHEVIIETPEHDQTLPAMPEQKVGEVLWAYRDRILDLKQDPRFQYILVFKNHGEAAGASLEHPHSQLIATPIVPKQVQEEVDGVKQYYAEKGRCVYCDMVQQELVHGGRVVSANDHFVATAPFASRFPFETWIIPRTHEASFENIGEHEVVSLARILKETLQRIERLLSDPPYNFVLHNAPCREEKPVRYHWHLEITPRLTRLAGFEWGTGIYINPTPPEEAAQYLRDAALITDR